MMYRKRYPKLQLSIIRMVILFQGNRQGLAGLLWSISIYTKLNVL